MDLRLYRLNWNSKEKLWTLTEKLLPIRLEEGFRRTNIEKTLKLFSSWLNYNLDMFPSDIIIKIKPGKKLLPCPHTVIMKVVS